MPRAQVLLLGAVWITSLVIFSSVADSFDVQQAGNLGLLTHFDHANSVETDEWSTEDLKVLKQMMDEHVSRYKAELEEFDLLAPRSLRSKRENVLRTPTIMGTNRIPSVSLNSSASQLESQGSISCFLWNGERFCILGGTIFVFKTGKVEPFLSGLPVGPNDHVKTHVYDDVIFLAIYNKDTAVLRLYLLRSPGWITLISIQHITGEMLKDCVFFEQEGTLYMALAIQLGVGQYAENVGMQCVIYEWLGTTFDMKHSFPAPGLRKMGVLQSTDTVNLVLIYGDSNVQLRLFTDTEETELVEIIDVDIDRINQFDAFLMQSQWCLFLGGSNKSYIYCLQDRRLLQWQVLLHNHTSTSVSWMRIQQDGIHGGYESVILIFNAFDPESLFEFYVSDSSDHFSLVFTSPKLALDGLPVASLAILDGSSSAHLYMATTKQNTFLLEGFAIQLLEKFHEEIDTDPLLQCLADIDFFISKLDPATIDHAEQLKNNMVHYTDDFNTNGTIVITEMTYSTPPVIGTVKVLYNFSEEFKRPNEIENTLKDLDLGVNSLILDLPTLLHTSNSSFKGRLTLDGTVTANEVRLPAASVNNLNNHDWNDFIKQAWRYSSEHTIDHDVKIEKVIAGNVSVGSSVGGSLPVSWLLKTGGVLIGKTNFSSLDVGGSVDVGNHLINGVAMSDVLEKTPEPLVIRGSKTFAAVEVENNVTADRINERDDFGTWAEKLVLQKSEQKQHFTGFVRLKGPVHVVDHFHSDWVNGINVSKLPELLVDKNSHQIVTGALRFTGPLLVVDAQVDSLNGHFIEDLLSTSGQQTIRATVDVEVLEVKGDLECPDINGQNVDDFVYVDEDDLQVILGPVQFEKDLVVKHLVMDNGTLNGVNITSLLNPPSLRIDSQIQANGDLKAHAAHVKVINGFELSNLRRQYWTKSTKQSIDVNVRMPFEVIVKENITTKTFMNNSLERDYYRTKANETFDVDVTFTDDVIMQSDLIIRDLTDINGVKLQALDEDVVKKEGDFTVLGTKTFEELIIHGDLVVEETFNNLNIPQDIAVLNRTQTLKGVQFAVDVTADGDVISSRGDITLNTIAGILLDDFITAAAMIDEDTVIDGSINFKRHLDVEELVIENLLNDHNVNNIVHNGMRKVNLDTLDLSMLTVHGQVAFKDSIDTDTINSYNVEEYLSQVVNMTNPGVITGTKKTSDRVIVSQDTTFDSFNDVRLNFTTLLTASDNQTITGEYVLDRLISKEISLQAINGQNLSNFVQTSGTKEVQVITGPIDIKEMTVEGALKIEDHILNGCQLTDYLDVTKFTHFDSLSIQNGSLLLEQPSVNNIDIATVSQKALRKDRSEVISGNVSFESDVSIDMLNVSHNRLGSIDLEKLLHGSMLKSVEQNVSGSVKYMNGIEADRVENVGHLKVTTWNGEDVQYMVNQVVLKTGNQTVKGKKTFTGDWSIHGNLHVNENIDDVPITSLVKTNEPRLPSGTKFTSLVVKKQLNVTSGVIDGVNITSALQQRVPLKGNCTLKSNITFKNPVTADNISAKKINNLNMTDLVWKTVAPGQVITGKKNLTGKMDIQGDITVRLLNGRNPEEMAAFIVLKDQNAEFQQSVSFDGGLTVLKDVEITNYNGVDLSQLMAIASAEIPAPAESRALLSRTPAVPVLLALQKSSGKLANFEFFEQIQQIPFNFPHGSNVSIQIQHCPIPTRKQSSTSDTAAGILVATHSTDGNSCKLKKICRCHRSVTLPSDTNGLLNTLRVPIRLKDYMEDNLIYGDRVRLLHSDDHLFIFTMESLPGCLAEKVTIAVFNPVTFKMITEVAFELNDTVVDVALEQKSTDGDIVLAISQKISGIWIYGFDGSNFHFKQLIETDIVASIHMVNYKDTIFLAVASYGLEAVSSIWNLSSSGQFELMKDVITVGATDVIFTKSADDIYLTFAQDPSSIDAYTDNWSQFKVPAQVLMYIPSFKTFEVVQQLDIDRVISLANLVITGEPFLAVATLTGKVKIYRLIKGQGFQAEQMFKNPGVRSIAGYAIRNETYLTTATESRLTIFVARLRGLQKPSITL